MTSPSARKVRWLANSVSWLMGRDECPYARPKACGKSSFGKLALTVTFSVTLSSAHSEAQPSAFELTPEAKRFVNGVINESINANTLFASQEAIATGRYTQRQTGEPDKEYTTIRLPGEVVLGDTADIVRPLVFGNGALLKNTAGFTPVDGAGEDDFTVTSLCAISTGVGAVIKITDNLALSPQASLSYSHVKNRYDFNNPYSQTFLQPADSELYNWSMDLFTYSPALKLYYAHDLGFALLNHHTGYTYLFNDSIHDDSSVIDINSSTGLLTNRIEVKVPTGLQVRELPLSIRPKFQWNNISGSAVKGLGLRDLFEIGADLLAEAMEADTIISTVSVGASYVTGQSFEGYHLGLGVTF